MEIFLKGSIRSYGNTNSKIFKSNVLKKTTARTLLLILMAVAVARTFRINEIARRLPIDVKTEKAKQKRVLRFLLDTPFPLLAAKQACFRPRLQTRRTSRSLKSVQPRNRLSTVTRNITSSFRISAKGCITALNRMLIPRVRPGISFSQGKRDTLSCALPECRDNASSQETSPTGGIDIGYHSTYQIPLALCH